jgi:hypothetical protein
VKRLYTATLYDIYFEPYLTSVVPPPEWAGKCPAYYRHISHLCGAFFELNIPMKDDRQDEEEIILPKEDDANILENYFVDTLSFVLDGFEVKPVVPRPEGVDKICRDMVDMQPNRVDLRSCEHTMLVLRNYRQREITTQLLAGDSISPADLSRAVQETSWRDLLAVLKEAPPSAWASLAQNKNAMDRLGSQARNALSRLTRFDFELVAWVTNSPLMTEIILNEHDRKRFSAVGEALRSWVTVEEEIDQRNSAAIVFQQAWQVAVDRYGFAQIDEEYFKNLPAMEAIANAVRHSIGGKFYRDHLSHNVRAALLSAKLLERLSLDLPANVNKSIIGFYAGLYHDITMPITTFPDTVSQVASALTKLQRRSEKSKVSRIPVQTILDRSDLKKSLSYVAMLASIRNLPRAFERESFKPWEDQKAILDKADLQILVEELLCAGFDEHALVSAALMFQYAVEGRSTEKGASYDSAVRNLLLELTGEKATPPGLELASILQAIALHDRRPAAEHHGVIEPPRGTPKPLQWNEFPIPAVVSIADEFQEWGRTLGRIDEIGTIDGQVDFTEEKVTAKFILSDKPDIFHRIPFSILEYILGKTRTVGRIGLGGNGAHPRALDFNLTLASLTAFRAKYVRQFSDCKIDFKEPFDFISFPILPSDGNVQRTKEIRGYSSGHVLAIKVDAEGTEVRDYILFDGDEIACGDLKKLLGQEGVPLLQLSLENEKLSISFVHGPTFTATLKSYYHGNISEDSSGLERRPEKGKESFLIVDLEPLVSETTNVRIDGRNPLHLFPHPHLLDFDWRFTEKTCRAIIEFARHSIEGKENAKICYLGCPSLAIWHKHLYADEETWTLLDQGHYALENWLQRFSLAAYRKYDVFDELSGELRALRFEIVIADPPWYNPHYGLFWTRASELVKDAGIVGISYYPEELDKSKAKIFQRTIGMNREATIFGSLEIDYEIPEFERPLGIHRAFQQPALNIYRPGFMDFYSIPLQGRSKAAKKTRLSNKRMLPECTGLANGHHLRSLSADELMSRFSFPLSIQVLRKGIENVYGNFPTEYIGWTTKNLIVKVTQEGIGISVESVKDMPSAMQRAIEEAERDIEHLPIEKPTKRKRSVLPSLSTHL